MEVRENKFVVICNPALALDLDFNQREGAGDFHALDTDVKEGAGETIQSGIVPPSKVTTTSNVLWG
ncbi:MAG: hypothetical protein IPP78_07710 [Holophagaceae bacterium]|nr:hypothetical protein [Holophagaceae bacterium]